MKLLEITDNVHYNAMRDALGELQRRRRAERIRKLFSPIFKIRGKR